MRLRLKISLLFSGVFLIAMTILGYITARINRETAEYRIYQGMETAGYLAGEQLSAQLKTYEDMIIVTGTDSVLVKEVSGAGNSGERDLLSSIFQPSKEPDGSKIAERMDSLAALYGFTSGNVLDASGISYRDGTDFSDRDYVKKALNGEINISDITLSKLTGKYGFSVAGPLKDTDGSIRGVVYFRMDVDFMDEILGRIKASENGYAFLVNGDGLVIVHPDDELIGTMNIAEENDELADMLKKLSDGQNGRGEYVYNGEIMETVYVPLNGTDGWALFVVVPKADYMSDVIKTRTQLILIDLAVWFVVVIVSIFFADRISATAKKVVGVMEQLSHGDFSNTLEPSDKKDEMAMIQNAVCVLRDTFTGIVSEEKRVLGAISNYDLSEADIEGYEGEFKLLADSVNQIKGMLTEIIMEVQSMGSQISSGTQEIADATTHLAEGATRQAEAVDQVVTNVEDIADRIMHSKENEDIVEEKLRNLESIIEKGNSEMTRLFETVVEIEAMSNDIQHIVNTIDSIAFQTNILALNASVEAARAGESGRGFAVVADEVGNLAEKSGGASKQTSELIDACLRDIKKANVFAQSTFECLKEIVSNAKDIDSAFGELAEATKQQAEKSANIKDAVKNIADVVSDNTSTSEETAAATVELSSQAETMSRMIQRFRIRRG